ncbi:restriction endonuclease subunit S [Escherichia coli]|uniref:restriction endonuclease subunit S n=1 Tax=Escherichia coli TaxID=562 RepID=UPI001778ED66|nr:restriction endonuclease subunit S [Escherichia coli]HAJ4156818.1 restriction endonuclease subunit S [Escherichia coli]HAJ4210550.1 restriction endonuclease subunit S [Escherichia coli]HAJ4397818.1 restriction endonuclease subunit S [Escherichia coli]HBD1216229.1 restriction endonuclease subunit S [Escherichia coli]HCJ9703483.1 restriction endonuclease subunit S [Escherichia coli]
MSELSYLEKLLDGVEVEWKTLGTVIKTVTASSKLKSQAYRASGKLPIVDQGIKFIAGYTDEDVTPIEAGKYIIFGDHSEHIKYVDFPFVQGADGLKILSPISANAKYIYHAFLKFYKKELSYKRHWSTAQQTLIPIPCPDNPEKSLAIQSEIVRILDKFTALTAELTAELNMRKKQYNYYRDQLLSFKEGEVEWKSLEDIALFRRGSFPQPYGNSEWYDGEGCMPFVQVADVADSGFTLHTKTKQQISKIAQSKSVFVEAGTIVVTLQGTIGRVAITQYDCYVDRTLAIFTNFKVKINKKYFAYQLKAKFDSEKEFARGSTLKTITKEEFSKFQLPLPSINEQNRIVSLLDKFDTLAHSIKQGLPREIELRQKQYEYYRDLLFSFPKPETVSN